MSANERAAFLGDLRRVAGLSVAVYWPVGHFEFIHLDDPGYVTANEHVRDGLTRDGLVWALTATDQGNWHPLTWLSHMLDVQLFGLNGGAHHLTNVLLHVANALLLFLVFQSMTGAVGAAPWWRPCLPSTRCTWNRWRGWRNAKTC